MHFYLCIYLSAYICTMDYAFELRWKSVLSKLESQFGSHLEVEGILFLIGVQELGQGSRKFKKDEKLDLMHIALCAVFEPYGYYEFSHIDKEGWPHYDVLKKLPFLNDRDQKQLLKQAIVEYFEDENVTAAPTQKSSDSSFPPQSA